MTILRFMNCLWATAGRRQPRAGSWKIMPTVCCLAKEYALGDRIELRFLLWNLNPRERRRVDARELASGHKSFRGSSEWVTRHPSKGDPGAWPEFLPANLFTSCRHNRPISAQDHDLASLRASAMIFVRRFERRSRQLRTSAFWSGRRNISTRC
jgi:hypothetical protein